MRALQSGFPCMNNEEKPMKNAKTRRKMNLPRAREKLRYLMKGEEEFGPYNKALVKKLGPSHRTGSQSTEPEPR